ncbi:hypothetical protein ACUL41_17875 [Virgibacillus natechei]
MNTVEQFITLPLAIKVLQHDKQVFQTFKAHRMYEGLIDSTIDLMRKDLTKIGYQKVKRLNKTRYIINDEEVEFSPHELRKMTSVIIREYFGKVKVEYKNQSWRN